MSKVDLRNYVGREQAYIKHCLLQEYLPEWAWKVQSHWDSLVYIDGFAGPWMTSALDHADSSFGVATRVLSKVSADVFARKGRRLAVRAILVDRDCPKFCVTDHELPTERASMLGGTFHADTQRDLGRAAQGLQVS